MNEQPTMKPYVIGLDLGGTNSVFGIVDARGDIKATTAIKTGGYEKVEDYVNASVESESGSCRALAPPTIFFCAKYERWASI